jgi:HEPN domain-containing protein
MKGFLTYKSIRFNKTHHLAEILDLLKTIDDVPGYIFSERELLIHLSDWAISGRYPDAVVKTPAPPKYEDIRPALEFALK